MKKTLKINQECELPPFGGDDLHFDGREIEGYNKTWNFIISEREPGKSTWQWKKVYNAFRKDGSPSVIIKRQVLELTDRFIQDTKRLLEDFTGGSFDFEYALQEAKTGSIDVKLNGKVFFRIVALSVPLSRNKSPYLKNVRYFFFDEFIVNTRIGEKYLKDEPFRVKELYNSYQRFADPKPKLYFLGNPYSLYNPYFANFNIPTKLLKPGAIIAPKENNYVVQAYQMKPELREKILKENPLYEFDDSYKKYGFDGIAIHDQNIRISTEEPKNFKLSYVFKIGNKILGVWRGIDLIEDMFYWSRKIESMSEVSNRRNVYAFDFASMDVGTMLMNAEVKNCTNYLKDAIQKRRIVYQDVECSYLMEEIYQLI